MERGYKMDKYTILLEQLKSGELASIEIEKGEFLAFRKVLVDHAEFKHFRGEAKQGGNIIFTYIQEARS